jgi:hypothetical protein
VGTATATKHHGAFPNSETGKTTNANKYPGEVQLLQQEFDFRFQGTGLRKYRVNPQLSTKIDVNVAAVPADIQMDVIDLQCKADLKIHFDIYDSLTSINFTCCL